jgi:hypothetical protein
VQRCARRREGRTMAAGRGVRGLETAGDELSGRWL